MSAPSSVPTMKTMLRRFGSIDLHPALGVTALIVTSLGSGVAPLLVNYFADHDDPVDPYLDLWGQVTESVPWLVGYLGPLTSWVEHTGDPGATIKAAAEAWRGVDVMTVNSWAGPYGGDLLGRLYIEMLSAGSKSGRGAFYTPMNVALLLGMMSGVEEGNRVLEPCCGSGAMLLAAGRALREGGGDPGQVEWVANDADPMAVALAGVNMTVRDMGPRIWLSVGDGLQLGSGTDGDPHLTQRPWWERPTDIDRVVDVAATDLVYHSPPALSHGGITLEGAPYGRTLGNRSGRQHPHLAPPGEGGAP